MGSSILLSAEPRSSCVVETKCFGSWGTLQIVATESRSTRSAYFAYAFPPLYARVFLGRGVTVGTPHYPQGTTEKQGRDCLYGERSLPFAYCPCERGNEALVLQFSSI